MMEKEKEEIKILGDDKKILTILAEKYGGEVLPAAHSGSKFFVRVNLDKEQLQKLHKETLGIPVCLMFLCK